MWAIRMLPTSSMKIAVGHALVLNITLINARRIHVDNIVPSGMGFLHSVKIVKVKTSNESFYKRDKTGMWASTECTKRLQPRGDTWNCGIWAIWIQEKWMQH